MNQIANYLTGIKSFINGNQTLNTLKKTHDLQLTYTSMSAQRYIHSTISKRLIVVGQGPRGHTYQILIQILVDIHLAELTDNGSQRLLESYNHLTKQLNSPKVLL